MSKNKFNSNYFNGSDTSATVTLSLIGNQTTCAIKFPPNTMCTSKQIGVYFITCTLDFTAVNPIVFNVLNGDASLGNITVANGPPHRPSCRLNHHVHDCSWGCGD